MLESYLVTSSGIKDGKPISYMSKIIEVKKGNDDYLFIDNKTFPKIEPEIIPFGSIITFESKRVATPQAGNLKVTQKQAD
jgi:hypothetical protein